VNGWQLGVGRVQNRKKNCTSVVTCEGGWELKVSGGQTLAKVQGAADGLVDPNRGTLGYVPAWLLGTWQQGAGVWLFFRLRWACWLARYPSRWCGPLWTG
jgi:hypothetical protein